MKRTFAREDPAIVINAAAYNQVDIAEKEPVPAMIANGLAVRNLAMCCRQHDARFVHFSTDYVFDSATGRRLYRRRRPASLRRVCGCETIAGELYAQAYLDAPLIIRTSGVFGPGGLKTARGNFIELMLRLAAGGQPIRVVDDHLASPTYAPLLAARSIDLLERGLTGVFHIGGGQAISWFDYAKMIFQIAGLHAELKPTNEREFRTAARRPKYSALSNAKMERCGIEPLSAPRNCRADVYGCAVACEPVSLGHRSGCKEVTHVSWRLRRRLKVMGFVPNRSLMKWAHGAYAVCPNKRAGESVPHGHTTDFAPGRPDIAKSAAPISL